MNTDAPDPKAGNLGDIIKHIRDLPMLSEVAHEMLTGLNDDDASMDTIAEKVAMDQSLAAKTLRLANASTFGLNSRVVTLQQAVSMLGMTHVKNMIRTTALTSSFPEPKCKNFHFKGFWRHSIGTAICAELISRTLRMKQDFAFTAGLLHDIGRLVLANSMPQQYENVLEYRKLSDCYLLEAEHAVMAVDHITAGLALAQHWQFSDAIQDAIRGHHQPDIPGLNALASVVHVADVIVHGLDLAETEDDLLPLLSESAWGTLSLSEADYHAIFHETELRFAALNQITL